MIGKTNSQTGGTLKGEKLNISLLTNQSSHADVLGAIVTLTNLDGATQYVWEGHEITVAISPGVKYEVSVSDVDGYKTPDKFTATSVADNARTISFEYKAEKVKVNISASNGMDMTGANVSINGKDYTYQGGAIEALVPFGTEYSVHASLVGSLVAPPVQFFTASIPLREINLEYRTCALVVNMLSNQANDTTIANLKASVTYGSTTVEAANGEVVDIPSGESITITFPEVENYNTPAPITFTTNIGLNERSVTYSTEFVIVNASANDGKSVDGVTASVTRVITRNTKPANGVYIQGVNGFLYTEAEWDGTVTPNGIAVVTDEHSFVIALSSVGSRIDGTYGTLVANVSVASDLNTAKTDYSGKSNTSVLLDKYGSTAAAAYYCDNYTFPNGQKGYLGAFGELWFAYQYKNDVVAALSKCGGNNLSSAYIRTSTQVNKSTTWALNWGSGTTYQYDKSSALECRPFATIEFTLREESSEEKIITNGKAQFKVEHGAQYSVVMSDKHGYETPAAKSFTAQLTVNNVAMEYTKSVSKQTVIRIDQTISDPATMITRIVDEGGIEAVRANSHRYVGALNFLSGKMEIRQLQDTDGTKFLDGTAAPLTTLGADVWMRLPQFYWKCVQHATDIWDFYIAYGVKPDDTYNTWDGKDLIGVYEAYAVNSKLYSYNGVTPATGSTHPVLKGYAANRGVGFSTVKWKHHCMMAMLFYSQYGNTNSQSIVGSGTSAATKATGSTNTFCMTDTVAGVNGDNMSINFWGLENWWGNSWEWVDNISCIKNGTTETWTITEDDGSQRIINPTPISNYASKLMFGENIDLANASSTTGSATTGYCDYNYISSTTSTRYVIRSGWSNNTMGGVSFLYSGSPTALTGATITSRLAYRGDYVIVE